MYRCLIIDDEPPAILVLENMLKQVPDFAVVSTFTNSIEGFNYLEKHEVDVVFLDVNMPDMTGFELLRTLSQPPLVVICSAHSEYAIDGFELQVADFLLKPFRPQRLLQACRRVSVLLEQRELVELSSPLVVRADKKLYRLDPSKIRYLQAYGDYVRIFSVDQNLMPKQKLQDLAEFLDEKRFYRVHRSYVINIEFVDYIEGNMVVLGDDKIPISEGKREDFKHFFSS